MRALIVDDEKTPRELLRDLVPWSRLGFTRVDAARNGLDALSVLENGDVDLVLTDMRMPKMDGAELAAAVRERWPRCVLIFLSGYSDKEYLKTAIRVHAQDYLDKPIDLNQVEAAVTEAARAIRSRHESASQREREAREREALEPLRKQAAAQELFGLIETSSEPRFGTGPIRILVASPPVGREVPASWAPSAAAVVNAEGSSFPEVSAAVLAGDAVGLVCHPPLAADPAAFERVAAELLRVLGELQPGVRLGVAPAGAPAAALKSLTEARIALNDAFYRPLQGLYPVRPAPRPFVWTPEDQRSWTEALRQGDDAPLRLTDALEQRCYSLRDTDLVAVRAVWMQALEAIIGAVASWGPPERSARRQRLEAELAEAPTLAETAELARVCYRRLFVRAPAELHAEDRVGRAREYIGVHFADPDLTVELVASHVGFSESYFCTVFKQTLGTTVKDYVTSVRLDRAKAYLWEKNPPTLADLALKVGYRDPNYFCTVFKRLTGTTPGAYRKRALG
jgi:two-component system response regulator YesN